MFYIDTNIIIHFLAGNDVKKQAASSTLFDQIEKGEISVVVPEMVIAEVVYVLSSSKYFHLPRKEVAELLAPILQFPHFIVQNRHILMRALHFYANTKGLDFPDAYIISTMEQEKDSKLFSYDHDFDDFPFISREEPSQVE